MIVLYILLLISNKLLWFIHITLLSRTFFVGMLLCGGDNGNIWKISLWKRIQGLRSRKILILINECLWPRPGISLHKSRKRWWLGYKSTSATLSRLHTWIAFHQFPAIGSLQKDSNAWSLSHVAFLPQLNSAKVVQSIIRLLYLTDCTVVWFLPYPQKTRLFLTMSGPCGPGNHHLLGSYPLTFGFSSPSAAVIKSGPPIKIPPTFTFLPSN